jgi:glucarate dehydratase
VEIITNDNISGISEIPGNAAINDALEAAGQLIIGKDPFQLNHIREILENSFGKDQMSERGLTPWDQRKLVHIFSSIEVACMDIIGKVTGRPVVDLLGGKLRDRVPLLLIFFINQKGQAVNLLLKPMNMHQDGRKPGRPARVNPEEIVAQAKAMCDEFGYKSIKLKGGVFEPLLEVDSMIALREAFGPDVPLRLDPNGVWKVETAIEYGQKLKPIWNTSKIR